MKHAQLLTLLAIPLVSMSSMAANVKFSPRADLNYTTSEIELETTAGKSASDGSLVMASLGVTASYDRIIADFDYKGTISGDNDEERTEMAFTGGYVFPHVAAFGGYKMTENSASYTDDALEVNGFFVGATYYKALGNRWVLNVTGAYTLADAEWDLRDSVGVKADGDGDGFSLAVMGTMKLNERMKLYVKLDTQTYSYDMDSSIDVEETYSRLSVGVKF